MIRTPLETKSTEVERDFTMRTVPTIYIELRGTPQSLEELSSIFSSGDLAVAKHDSIYVLCGPRIERQGDAHAIRREAERVLAELNGIARVLLGHRLELTLGPVGSRNEHGVRSMIIPADPVSLCLDALKATVLNFGRPNTWPTGLFGAGVRAALHSADASRALRFLGKEQPSWMDLWKTLEAIEAANGGVSAVNESWVSARRRRRFKQTANSVGAIGDESRHGAEKTEPPPNPMPYNNARALIYQIGKCWLEALDRPQ